MARKRNRKHHKFIKLEEWQALQLRRESELVEYLAAPSIDGPSTSTISYLPSVDSQSVNTSRSHSAYALNSSASRPNSSQVTDFVVDFVPNNPEPVCREPAEPIQLRKYMLPLRDDMKALLTEKRAAARAFRKYPTKNNREQLNRLKREFKINIEKVRAYYNTTDCHGQAIDITTLEWFTCSESRTYIYKVSMILDSVDHDKNTGLYKLLKKTRKLEMVEMFPNVIAALRNAGMNADIYYD